eukprot:GHRR01004830.1.p1 GENE.GHRR01004830.1~~GHRR01004830.1.p1  ORF type:complete len:291 (+),score=85.23 GHRR01004830.1:585-1457(+)
MAGSTTADPHWLNVMPDQERVILHFDVDCFYAQVEEGRHPSWRGKPLAVTQKYLVVTANYPARAAGVTKLMGIQEALAVCSSLVLVSGEDLTPYRVASNRIREVFSRWGPCEKLGLDESWVDVTQEVLRRVAAGATCLSTPWIGHLMASGMTLTQDSKHRPQDLRIAAQTTAAVAFAPGSRNQFAPIGRGMVDEAAAAGELGSLSQGIPAGQAAAASSIPAGWELRLRLGCTIAAEMRAAAARETGYRCSAGIACNKLLAKLMSGLHKPNDQTVIPPTEAQLSCGAGCRH